MTDITIKCVKCGGPIMANQQDTGKTGMCPGCGGPIMVGASTPPPPVPLVRPALTSGYAIASLVLGILSIVPGVWLGGLLMGILAIVFSRMAMKRINTSADTNGQGLATAGLITGSVGLSLSVLVILIFGAIAGIAMVFFASLLKAMMAIPR
jgi:DNA-directed RNA polymerase subunit RPC12/RpoP